MTARVIKAPLSEILSSLFRDAQLFFISGRKGAGKTLLATTIALAMQRKFDKILANYRLYNIPNFEPLTKYSQIHTARKSLIIIDESYIFFNSRMANSRSNMLFNEIVARARKSQNVFILISHSPRFVDKTLRMMANGVFFPSIKFETIYTPEEGTKELPKLMEVLFISSIEGFDGFLTDESFVFYIPITQRILDAFNTYEPHFDIELDIEDTRPKKRKSRKKSRLK